MPSWEQYLWNRNLVALDPLLEHAGGLQLLDVVVKNGGAGILAEPTLLKAGSIISLQTTATDVHADWSATSASILDHQQKLVGVRKITTDVFCKAEQLENFQCNTDSGCGILASIVSLFRSGASSATYGSIYVEDIVNEWVATEFLERLVSGDGADSKPLWKPNVQKIKQCSRQVPLPTSISSISCSFVDIASLSQVFSSSCSLNCSNPILEENLIGHPHNHA